LTAQKKFQILDNIEGNGLEKEISYQFLFTQEQMSAEVRFQRQPDGSLTSIKRNQLAKIIAY